MAPDFPTIQLLPGGGGRQYFNITRLESEIFNVSQRLQKVCIKNLDWRRFLTKYDRPSTLFFLDPPYYGNEKDYGEGLFERQEFEEMAEILGCLQGKFILTLNCTPETREIFGRFNIEIEYISYGLPKKNKKVEQLIISN